MEPTYSGVSHVSLTVTDVERAKQWYRRVLGWQQVMEGEEDGTTFAVGLVSGNVLVGFRRHAEAAGGGFDPRRTGLDHLAFAVESRDQLSAWEQRLANLDVSFSETVDAPYGHVLSFKDPDGIALELFAMPTSG